MQFTRAQKVLALQEMLEMLAGHPEGLSTHQLQVTKSFRNRRELTTALSTISALCMDRAVRISPLICGRFASSQPWSWRCASTEQLGGIRPAKFTWAKSVTYASLRSVTHVSGRSLKATGILNRPSPEVSGRFWPAHHFLPKLSQATFAFARICEGMCLHDLTLRNLDRCLPGATLG
jgi:hypothetical protein